MRSPAAPITNPNQWELGGEMSQPLDRRSHNKQTGVEANTEDEEEKEEGEVDDGLVR